MMQRIQAAERLRAASVKPSEPRLAIYLFLDHNRIHPTVDTIYRALHKQYPTLSRTTVYNTVKLFEKRGLLSIVKIEDGELRFDANTRFHAHFKCSECGEILDAPFFAEPEMPSVLLPDGYQINQVVLDYYGVCAACVKNPPENK